MGQGKVKQKYWGLRTLGFLSLAIGSIIAGNLMQISGAKDYLPLPLLGLVIGFIGAAICSYKGIRAMMKGPRLY